MVNKFGESYGDLLLDIQMGAISGASIVHVFGANPAVGTSFTPVWDVGGAYTFLSAAEILNVRSDDAADAGFGAKITYLNSAWEVVVDELTLVSELVDVTTTQTAIRVISVENNNGTDYTGTVTVKNAANTITLAAALPANQASSMAIYSIPAGHTGYLFHGATNAGKGKDAQITMQVRVFGEVFKTAEYISLYETSVEASRPFVPLPEKSDIVVNAQSDLPAYVSTKFSIILLRN